MASFTVATEPVEDRTYHSDKAKSDLVVWTFDLDSEGKVELHKKPGNKPPRVGTVVNGNVKKYDDTKRLYLDQPGQQNGGSGGGRRSSDPSERRSIERQVSAKIAAETLYQIGRDADEEDVRDWGRKLRWLVDEVHDAITAPE